MGRYYNYYYGKFTEAIDDQLWHALAGYISLGNKLRHLVVVDK